MPWRVHAGLGLGLAGHVIMIRCNEGFEQLETLALNPAPEARGLYHQP